MLTANGRPVTKGKLLGKGGQGEVFAVPSHPGQVYKQYTADTLAKDPTLPQRLHAMIAASPPERVEPASKHMLLAWPEAVVLDDGRFSGFLMPVVDMASTVELHRVTNPSDRRQASGSSAWIAGFTWKYLVRTAANLAQATRVLHDGATVIGDFNLKNVRVSDHALVTLIDCDSMQITDPGTGDRFFCPVVMPEFLPPELVGATLKNTVRHASGDLYALAVHLYQLLLEGEHPFRGVWKGPGEKPSVPELARTGDWALKPGGNLAARPAAITADLLPDQIVALFRRAFEDGAGDPGKRPTAGEWHAALVEVGRHLTECSVDKRHWYVPLRGFCPWCEHVKSRPAATQSPLPRATAPTTPTTPTAPSSAGRPAYAGPSMSGSSPAGPSLAGPSFQQTVPSWRPPAKRRTGLIVAGMIAAVLVLVCGGNALAGAIGGDSSGTGTSNTNTNTGAGTGTGAITDSATEQADQGDQALDQATAMHDLLADSGTDRAHVLAAIQDQLGCGDSQADIATFDTAAGHRQDQHDRAAQLVVSALDDGTELQSQLVSALQASTEADTAYSNWSSELASGCTRTAARSSSDYKTGFRHSQTADTHKKAFVELWNPICDTYGWPAITDIDI